MYWKPWDPKRDSEPTFGMIGAERLTNDDIIRLELTRAKGALAFLKAKIGNDHMRELLADELRQTANQNAAWVQASGGAWRTDELELVVPGPSAKEFHTWFLTMMKEDRETDLRAGHPDHFMNRPLAGGAQGADVIENIGEDDLPWFIHIEFTTDPSQYPVAWKDSYPERLGAVIYNMDGVLIGSAMHEMKDAADGMHILLRIILPEAAPDHLVRGHLEHFAVEFGNWTRMARERDS